MFLRESRPETGRANLYFFRATQQDKSHIYVEILLDGRRVGLLGAGEYFVISIKPGPYALAANSPVGSNRRYVGTTTLEVRPNMEYFVEVSETERTNTMVDILPIAAGKSNVPVPIVTESTSVNVRKWEISERHIDELPVAGILSCSKVDANP
ncbi:MAG: hypothetical protein ROZ00_06120 [Denitratisoma sp.]|nr:hypothetical protein [Denitratisoma sp.]